VAPARLYAPFIRFDKRIGMKRRAGAPLDHMPGGPVRALANTGCRPEFAKPAFKPACKGLVMS